MENKEKNILKSIFQEYSNKKILIYGTGKNAEKVIEALEDFPLVGVVDGSRIYGTFKGLPILCWEEIDKRTADVLIIATRKMNYDIIYNRIRDKCKACRYIVLGMHGEDLAAYLEEGIGRLKLADYCSKSMEELKAVIDDYDAISFDVFDTLIMRKTLEPRDVFNLVEERLRNKGINIPNFMKYRKEADRLSKGGNIRQIYDILQQMLKIDNVQKDIIMQEELSCEENVLMPRRDMVKIMDYAFKQGKRISLISDMYLPDNILERIIQKKGIKNYHKLYVSCDYKTGKGGQLFEIYKRDVSGRKCLHIGDDLNADKVMPESYGIDSYAVCSAIEMLRMSELHEVLGYADNSNERNLIGLIISEIFNSPFAFHGTFGVLKFDRFEDMGKIFFAPMVMKYIEELTDCLKEHEKYSGVLFPSRDGYFFQKMYEVFKNCHKAEDKLVPSFYFHTSRKLAIRSTVCQDEVYNYFKGYLNKNSADWLLKNIIGLNDLVKINEGESQNEYIDRNRKEVVRQSKEVEKNYRIYMKKEGIKTVDKYLFCEVNAKGTSQYALSYLFDKPLDGFYWYNAGCVGREFNNFSILKFDDFSLRNDTFTRNLYLQEMFLSDVIPSVESIDSDGNPVFALEMRSREEIESIEKVQNGAENFLCEYWKKFYKWGEKVRLEIIEILFRSSEKSLYDGECELIYKMNVEDSLLGGNHKVIRA